MEDGQIESDCDLENIIGTSYTFANPATCPATTEHFDSPRLDPIPSLSAKKRKAKGNNQVAQEKDTTPSVSNCYVFKSRLQEYCQKAGLTTPVYETIKQGPSHEPSFRSAVVVNNVRYDSLPGFFNRKAAEQSAAEVALIEIANSVDMKFGISQPVHETGLCKNLLQEYAQKINYAIPLYECHKDEKQGRSPMYSCVVEIGGIKYIGASASTKKEAELKAARTAMLAIQSSASVSDDDQASNSIYTVVPQKKKIPDIGKNTQDNNNTSATKPKKARFKKQRRRGMGRCNSAQGKTDGVGPPHRDMAGGFDVDLGRAGLQIDASNGVGHEIKTSGGSDIRVDGPNETMGNICSSGVYNGSMEITNWVPFDGCFKDGGSTGC